MDKSISCTIGLGSNTTDREYQITKAIEHICAYLQNVRFLPYMNRKLAMGKTNRISTL